MSDIVGDEFRMIKKPIITSILPDIASFYNLVRKINRREDVEDEKILDFIRHREHRGLCKESFESFALNVKKNYHIMTLSSRLAGADEVEVKKRLELMDFYVTMIGLKKMTINDHSR